jgi:hypothetical protein
MQRGEHQTEFANDEVNESYDADEQQPRGTSQLHGPSRLNLSDFAPDNKADQRLDSCETLRNGCPLFNNHEITRRMLARDARRVTELRCFR